MYKDREAINSTSKPLIFVWQDIWTTQVIYWVVEEYDLECVMEFVNIDYFAKL